jgi:hypothetical protein
VSRDFEPAVGQWYENVDDQESFRVLSIDEDAELVEVEYLNGDVEEIDMDTWAEFNLERIEQPEGWSGEDLADDEDDDEDDDWDEDEDDEEDDDDDDDDDDLDEEEEQRY